MHATRKNVLLVLGSWLNACRLYLHHVGVVPCAVQEPAPARVWCVSRQLVRKSPCSCSCIDCGLQQNRGTYIQVLLLKGPTGKALDRTASLASSPSKAKAKESQQLLCTKCTSCMCHWHVRIAKQHFWQTCAHIHATHRCTCRCVIGLQAGPALHEQLLAVRKAVRAATQRYYVHFDCGRWVVLPCHGSVGAAAQVRHLLLSAGRRLLVGAHETIVDATILEHS